MSRPIIAFQGVAGAHADLSCRQNYPYHDTLPCPSFDDVFEAVSMGKAQLGMIPIENSQAGRVAEIHNILPRTNLYIIAEHFQRIEHYLMGIKGSKLDDIKVAYSHPQALMQCKNNLRELGLETMSFSNTAAAAKQVAEKGNKHEAAIGSKLAAELYGLEILRANIEDSNENLTVFAVLSKEPYVPKDNEARVITSVIFSIRNIPAALYKALGGFATNGVNMLKLESYIPGGISDSAQFFICFEGNPEERKVQLALEELGFFSNKLRVIGVYPADPNRKI